MRRTTTESGSLAERKGWILVALICGVMVLFGSEMYFTKPALTEKINGSLCCNGRVLADLPKWGVDYLQEMARYMGTFTILAGTLAMVIVLVPLRRRQRWAWWLLWAVPVLFLVHGAALGSFPFDFGPLGVSAAGLLLSIRPVFGAARQPASSPVAGARAEVAVG